MQDIAYLITENVGGESSSSIFSDAQSDFKKSMVYVEVESCNQSEFFKAGMEGFKPEFKLSTFQGNYKNEELVEFKGNVFKIYRTYYKDDDLIELYLTRRLGVG